MPHEIKKYLYDIQQAIEEIESLIENSIIDNSFIVQDNDIKVVGLPGIIVDCVYGENNNLSSGATAIDSPVIEIIMLVPLSLYNDNFKEARIVLGENWIKLLAEITGNTDEKSYFDSGEYAGGKFCVRAKTKIYL